MNSKCPVCGQTLPQGINTDHITHRLAELEETAKASEAKRLEKEFRARSAQREAAIYRKAMESAARNAAKGAKSALAEAKRQTGITEQRLQAELKKERLRNETKNSQLCNQINNLQRKLEEKSNQERGDGAEEDLLDELRKSFPQDRIEPVGKGRKGADIVHHVIESSKEAGRIVYECKDVGVWQNAFITKLKQSCTQHTTPFVVLVTQAFPHNQKRFCVVKGIPVVERAFAAPLAQLLRDAVVRINELRRSHSGQNGKGQELLEYVGSDEFGAHFKYIAEGIESLRELQQTEKDSHARQWQKQADLFDGIDNGRRKVKTKFDSIVNGTGAARKPRIIQSDLYPDPVAAAPHPAN